ncbi:hypothetical protein EBB07_10480 [Paenibacillaceae bacterium]|nr:hypothetical protein EBB07_10480 [Paenibacillaceae bacterium]
MLGFGQDNDPTRYSEFAHEEWRDIMNWICDYSLSAVLKEQKALERPAAAICEINQLLQAFTSCVVPVMDQTNT